MCCWRILNRLLEAGHALAYHIRQLSRRLQLLQVANIISRGKNFQHIRDGCAVVLMVIGVRRPDFLMDGADLNFPGLL